MAKLQVVGPGEDTARRSSRFDRRKEEILNAAGALFNKHGLRDATLAVIAAEIGLNLKSLRYYFEKREDLVAAAFMRSIDLHRGLAETALAEDSVESRVRRFVRDYFALRASVQRGEVPEFVHFGDLRSLTPPHSEIAWPAYGEMFKAIRRLFVTRDKDWGKSRLSASAHMLVSQLLWSVIWADEYLPEDAPRIAERLSDLLLHGIARAALPEADLARLATPLQPPDGAPDRLSAHSFLRAATALINHCGYRGASVDRISAELKVTKGAFYHHNETRDGLVVACFEATFAQLRDAQNSALASEASGLAQVTAASVSLVTRQMRESGVLLRTSALTAVGPELRLRMSHELSRFTLRFHDMLNDGLIDGSVRPCNVHIAAEMVTAMVNSAEELARWVPDATAENAAGLYVRPLLDGLLR